MGTRLGKEGIPDQSTDLYPITITEKRIRHQRGPVHMILTNINYVTFILTIALELEILNFFVYLSIPVKSRNFS